MTTTDALLANARAALDREGQLLDVLRDLLGLVAQLNTELGELRDEHLALSNRIEAVTRAAAPGLSADVLMHSVPWQPRTGFYYCFECERQRLFAEGKCGHCATPLSPAASEAP